MSERHSVAAVADSVPVATESQVPVIQLTPAPAAAIERGEQPCRHRIHANETGNAVLVAALQGDLAPR